MDVNFGPCDKCVKNEDNDVEMCCKRNKCVGGYYVKVSKPRASKYELLLKAVLNGCSVIEHEKGVSLLRVNSPSGYIIGLTDKQEAELIKIKERMK